MSAWFYTTSRESGVCLHSQDTYTQTGPIPALMDQPLLCRTVRG